MSQVAEFVTRLATAKKIKLKIGERFTGKREFYWDSRSGEYSESLPLVGYDEWLIQIALLPKMLVKRRRPDQIRQKS